LDLGEGQVVDELAGVGVLRVVRDDRPGVGTVGRVDDPVVADHQDPVGGHAGVHLQRGHVGVGQGVAEGGEGVLRAYRAGAAVTLDVERRRVPAGQPEPAGGGDGAQPVGVVGDDPVHAVVDEPVHRRRVVDGPRYDRDPAA